MAARWILPVLAALPAAYASRRPSVIVPHQGEGPVVHVKECSIPDGEPWYARFAVHTWIDYRAADGTWTRVGVPGPAKNVRRSSLTPEEAREDLRWSEPVRVIDVTHGDDAIAAIAALAAAEDQWERGEYRAFPGPNSNTFVERVARATPCLSPTLSPNATGKDHAWLRAGVTASGTGVELESPALGVEVGLREGVQLHVAQLPLGVQLWPPALILPFLPAIGPRLAP